jgi:glycosyltransferase involved in cell wall biosynthesis
MKKILFFETSEFTGATRVTRTLAKLARRDYDVALAKVGLNVREDIESSIEIEKPDILFSSFVLINSEVIKIGKQHSLYIIIRNDYKIEDISDDLRQQVIETYPLADEIVAQTEAMRQDLIQLLSVDPCKVKVLDNPLDTEEILEKIDTPDPYSSTCFHFLWVGRKDPIKDLPTLQKAFEIVHLNYPQTDLTLVSDDPNPYRWMKYADCLVISSRSEASPNVLREALFIGTPVISTDCSPTVRQLLPPQNIVPVNDSKALAEAMIHMIEFHVNSRIS